MFVRKVPGWCVALEVSLCTAACVALSVLTRPVLAQAPERDVITVWDGVYTAEQAERGWTLYESHCAHCHRVGVGEAVPIFGEHFFRRWFEDDLASLVSWVSTSMPADAPGILEDHVYLDIVAYMLEASGLPPGDEPIALDPERLSGIIVVDEGGLGGDVPDFSLIQVSGCLSRRSDDTWVVTQATEPDRIRDPGAAAPAELVALMITPLGDLTFQIPDRPALGRDALAGHKILAKGTLIRQPGDDRISPATLQSLGPNCAP